MKIFIKRLLGITCSTVLCFSLLSSIAFASDLRDSNLLNKLPIFEEIQGNADVSLNKVLTITDKVQIEEIAKKQNLTDPESITKITYEYYEYPDIKEDPLQKISINTNSSNKIDTSINTASTYGYHMVYNVKDLGTGFSYWDSYDSSIYGGPATVTKTYTRISSSTYTADVKVDYELIEAAVGFKFELNKKVQESYTFSVASGKQIELRVFTNYQKKSYDIGYNNGGLLYKTGSGTAQKPVGLIFQQIQR